MAGTPDELLDRYLSGEASPQEERDLVQAALDDPELFDLLTTAGLVNGALRVEAAASTTLHTPRPNTRRNSFLVGAGLAAAAAVATAVMVSVMRPREVIESPPTATSTPGGAVSSQRATEIAVNTPPVFLSALLSGGTTAQTEFRAATAPDRLPKEVGMIVSSTAGIVEVDLGAVDGLSNGSLLTVVGGPGVAPPVARLTVTTVFRDRARGQIPTGVSLPAKTRVKVDAGDHLLALSEQIGARISRGETDAAQRLASQALPIAQSAATRGDARRAALTQLAALAHRTGDTAAAERHLDAAAEAFENPPAASPSERAEILNALGLAAAARGDLASAENSLTRAQAVAPGSSTVAVQIANNLGAVAALRGDRARAESFYQAAQTLADATADRNLRPAVDKNLANLRTPQ
jgi:Flp pilus assembly protein TadD